MDQPTGEESTSKAIKRIQSIVKKQERKLERVGLTIFFIGLCRWVLKVGLTISLRGIKMETVATGEPNLDFSIYRWCL